jgi:transcriptional regulator with GAF, ATPase, and Fis domain
MDVPNAYDQGDAVKRMQELLEQQKREIERLQGQLKQEHFAEDLHKLLTSSAGVGLVLSPFSRSHLLEMIVQIATQFINARSSSLFLVDEATQELAFEVAMGPAAQEVKKFRVPLGHGIAGLVALTGQPMAIAHAHQDARLATDIAFAVNYVPESILCVPLFYDDRVIGVLEMLDKQGRSSFGTEDIDVLGQFANIAAVAIAQSSAFLDQQTFFQAMVRSFGEVDAEQRQLLYRKATVFTNWANTTDMLSTRARELALYVNELILDGEQSCDLCINVLQGFVSRIRERNKLQASLTDFSTVSLAARG